MAEAFFEYFLLYFMYLSKAFVEKNTNLLLQLSNFICGIRIVTQTLKHHNKRSAS